MLLRYAILFCLPCILGFPRKVPVGGLFDNDEMIQKAFELSVKAVNKNIFNSSDLIDVYLTAKSEKINEDTFYVARTACELVSTGVAGIFGPQSRKTSNYVQSMCDTMDIPYIIARWEPKQIQKNVVNLYPHNDVLSTVYYELVKEYSWKSYAILYENVDSLIRMNRLLKLENVREHSVTIYHLGRGPNFRSTLLDVRMAGHLNIVIDCSYDILATVLVQAQQVGIMSGKHSVIVTSLDFPSLDLEPYQYSGVNLTGVRLIDPEDSIVREIFQSPSLDWEMKDTSRLRVEPALAYDAVQLFAMGYSRLRDSVKGNFKRLYCNDSKTWEHGFSLSNLMRAEEIRGLTGLIRFDNMGVRSDFRLDILQNGRNGLKKIGNWDGTGLRWIPEMKDLGKNATKSLHDKHFTVMISLTDPYGMLKQSAEMMTGNERYEGFAIDIIQEMSKMLGFNYTFEVQTDNDYGKLDKNTKKWTGMIKRILEDTADLAITDLTITSERESVVDFTTPFMNLGISVLYRKPTRAPPGFLSFLLPFSKDIWIHVIGVYILVTVLLFFIGRLCPVEWTNPYPCITEPEVLKNPFTPKDTPFFVVGSLLKSPTGFAPAGISTRTMATAWWFFCLIMTNTYIANLAAALSTKQPVWPFKVAEELANQKTIKYGAKKGGSTFSFFENSTHPAYEIMYNYMKENSDVMVEKNELGLAKVQQENYAFLMESTSIEYMENRHCNVTQVGGWLDAKGYGIAMKKDAPFRNDLSGAILKLKENGKINELRDKWWRQKRGGDKCQEKGVKQVESLNFEDVGGVFLILISGVSLSWFYTGFCLVWHVRKVSIRENVPFKEELIRELKFLMKCSGTKVVRRKYSAPGTETDIKRLVFE